MPENIKTLSVYLPYVERVTQGTITASGTKELLVSKYKNLFEHYAVRTPNGIFIKDPSQNDQIVSEGQGYWQILATSLARIDASPKYQDDFDVLLKGTQYMIKLAKDAGNRGEFPAWKAVRSGNTVVLSKDQYGLTANSASDADLDIVRSLVYAQELVERGIWTDKGYDKLLDKLIPAAEKLFSDQNGLYVLSPSEDWNDFQFTDYLDPASYREIADYLSEHNKPGADFWEKAAADSMRLYGEILNDTGTFPANINITARGDINSAYADWLPEIEVKTSTNMWYDGIRSPWRIARYMIMFAETDMEARAAREAIAFGLRNNFSHTHSRKMDAAMYLPLSVAVGDASAATLAKEIIRGKIPEDKYFENTLELLGLIDTVFPRKININ